MAQIVDCKFIGGPWDGLTLNLPDSDFNEIIVRNSTYWPSAPHEFVYRRDGDGEVISIESLTASTYRLVEQSAVITDNVRLVAEAKEREQVVNDLIWEVQREKQRWKDRAKRAKKKATKPPTSKRPTREQKK